MATFDINRNTIPFYVDYFHAISRKEEQKDIFATNAGSVMITPYANYDAYDVTATVITPLKELGFLKVDGARLLVPLEGLLVVPDVATTTRFPLVIIGHGQALGHFGIEGTKPKVDSNGHVTSKGHVTFTKLRDIRPPLLKGVEGVPFLEGVIEREEMLSYRGYKTLQVELSKNGIASFSINLNIVNDLDSNHVRHLDDNVFEAQAVDFNQRILLTFLHLKLLRILADEPIDSSSGDDQPIKFLDGTTFKTLPSVLANPVLNHAKLQELREVIPKKIDFNKLGFMGHSRGADAVSRLPAYFFAGATAPDPTFPVNKKVDARIKALAIQIGRPPREVIKCILALEPTATINESDPTNERDPKAHGYVIDNNQTMYFVVVGTHDEDVTMDPVRIYEFPECPKVMIAISGATHKRFNSVWALSLDPKKLRELEHSALSVPVHEKLLHNVAGSCFIGTLGGNPSLLLRYTKGIDFIIDLPLTFALINLQSAWKFGFPFPTNTPVNLDRNVTSTSQKSIKGQGYNFEQQLTAFFVERANEGTETIRIPIDPNTGQKLSNFTHFSFRFAKGFDVESDPNRIEKKNFTIQFFENDTPIGKPVAGGNINLTLQAFRAFDRTKKPNDPEPTIEHSILMQTAEIALADHLSATELPRITRIDINVIPDVTKAPPNFTPRGRKWGTIGGAILGGGLGVGGAAAYIKKNPDVSKVEYILIGGGVAGTTLLGGKIAYEILEADKNAFVFKDFLLTNRQIPMAKNS